ncbi:MAG TPA: hypothetical protein VGE16_14675 [Albitalea sp.]
MHQPTRAHRSRTTLAGVVLVVLVLMQSLAQLHRIVHSASAPDDAPHVQAMAGAASAEPGGWLERLFDGHDRHGCDAFDQLTHTDTLCGVPALPPAAEQTSAPAERHHAWQLAHQAAGFLARGPPLPS